MLKRIKKRIRKRHIAFFAMLSIIGIGVVFYYQGDNDQDEAIIRPYDEAKDFTPLVKLINRNKFWLSERLDFSGERMLKWRAPNEDPNRKGEARIFVVDVDDETAGFIAFYKKSSREGHIWLLGVAKKFRGHGYAARLVKHAIKELKKQNSRYITLATRTINTRAISLYKKLGFKEKYRYEKRGMMGFIKRDI